MCRGKEGRVKGIEKDVNAEPAQVEIERILALPPDKQTPLCKPSLLDEIANRCLLNLLEVFMKYRLHQSYKVFKTRVRSHNRQRPSSFDYLKILGTYNNSKVFMVRKKSTKRVYSMKIYSKRELMKVRIERGEFALSVIGSAARHFVTRISNSRCSSLSPSPTL